MPKQQSPNDSRGCVCMCSVASSTHQSARLPLSILRNICICCVTGTACSALDGLSHLLADSLESLGSCRDLLPEPQPSQQQPLGGWIFFPRLVNCACAIRSMQIALLSLQTDFVEIVVYLGCQFRNDRIWFISFMNQMKLGPDSQMVRINMTKVK